MSARDLARGTLVLHYRIEAVLGRGGVGVVYLAEDLRLKRRVALKVLSPALAGDERFRERFLAESELAASLDHANVIPIYEAGEAEGSLYISMRYVEGSDLKAQLAEGPLSAEQVVALADQVGGALDAAHERGLLHGDVKPSNVLIDGRGHVYLADFGLTRRIGGERSAEGEPQLMGTIDYVAPEVIRGDPVDGRADIYSLGCLLYECLTGRQPFRGGNDGATLYAHLEDEPPATGGPADPVLARALAKDPDERYQSCAELSEAARDALGVAAPRRSLLPLAIAAVAVLVAAAALAAFLAFRGDRVASGPQGELVRIDPAGNTVAGRTAIGAVPAGIAVDSGRVWITSLGDSGIWRVDSRSLDADRISTQGRPIGVAARGDTAYVVNSIAGPYGGQGSNCKGETAAGVTAIAAEAIQSSHTISTCTAVAIASGPAGIWLARGTDVVQIEPQSDIVSTIGKRVKIPSPNSFPAVAVGAKDVWVLEDAFGRRLWRIDPVTARIVAKIDLPFTPAGVAVEPGSVWVTAQLEDEVARIDPATNRIVATVKVGHEPLAVAADRNGVWVANTIDGTVTRIDPATNRATATIDVHERPESIAASGGSVWVAGDES
jgi:YVTN family beta-propeller protein